MKTETIRHTVRLLVIVTLTACAFATAASAQSSFTGKFTLPYEVHWGTVMLPAGDYSITMASPTAPAEVWSANGKTKMFTVIPIAADSQKGAASIFITVRGNERRVQSLNLPQLGQSLTYEPLSRSEREALAKGRRLEAVPVITAEK